MTGTAADLIEYAQAAARLGVSTRTLQNWVAAGRVRAVKVGPRRVRFEVQEVERVLRGEPKAAAN